jgi:hypothetical protein
MQAVIILTVTLVVAVGLAWSWYSSQGPPYVFSPCPGLTVTSRVTTGIWNCPNEPAPGGSSQSFSAGQFVNVTGTWSTGYGTIGCVPQVGESSCAVPQIASLQDYLNVRAGGEGMWFVVQWKQGSAVQLIDGQTVTISGTLIAITYPSTPGSTYPIYHVNNQTGGSDLLQPQPSLEISDAVLG